MNDDQKKLEEWSKIDCDATEFDKLESKLESQLEEQLSDLESLELDREKIGNPDSIGETVKNVVWEQFLNQVGVVAGEDFIKVGSIYSLFGHPNRQNPLICQTTVV
ncbi:MAG: hypothetical protein IJL48_09165 [Bacteroidales bacterium]|nr:hypothetical protein [Bacteroidales bacterium]